MGAVAVDDSPLLLDTAAFILWHAGSRKLPARVRAVLLTSLERPIHVSTVSAFEISTKVRIGKLRVPAALLDDFSYIVEADGFRVLELGSAAAVRAGQFESDHRDPFDRLLAAQSVQLGATLVTPDRAFAREFGVTVLW